MAFLGSTFSIFGRTEKGLEDKSPFAAEWKRIGKQGDEAYDYGRGLTSEGIGGLRDLRKMAEERYRDPLGETGRGIFARARGAQADNFARNVNAGDARRRQLALQSGGSLTPEQIAALDQESRRSAGEQQFGAENELAMAEGELALTEMGKFFDRMSDIDKTITGVGQDEKTRGLQSILAAIMGRQERVDKIVGHALGPWG
jgi:hypothetical protein